MTMLRNLCSYCGNKKSDLTLDQRWLVVTKKDFGVIKQRVWNGHEECYVNILRSREKIK